MLPSFGIYRGIADVFSTAIMARTKRAVFPFVKAYEGYLNLPNHQEP
ncbi:hypothetical protein CEV32_0111 [Brucella rhizosphaerae]|uniref:Uncharacterized protein n=1 Tax=Brucella rhizosphaerae TaxID=571254 RepID=A0A256FHI3_9HYPH|nr:hypothetical protein CEV32_0111 [Brucella rhizosphaerae]